MANQEHPEQEPLARFPGALSLKDLITLVSVAVSLTIAWGVFGTRMTLLEKEVETHQQVTDRLNKSIELDDRRMNTLELRIQDNEILIDNLYDAEKVKQPRRRASPQ